MEAILVRSAHIDDHAMLRGLYQQIDDLHYHAHPDLFQTPNNEQRTLEYLREQIDSPDSAVFVALVANRIVGLSNVLVKEKSENAIVKHQRYAEVDEIVIDKRFRRRGIASTLLQASIEWARQQNNVQSVRLGVFAFNEDALRFYEAKGFQTLYRQMVLDL